MFKFWPYLFLFFSGLSALSYQVVWMREFRLVFGASTASTAAVSALFMAGLGLGGWLLGPRADRHGRPLLLYGGLELGIAILAGLSPFTLDLMRAIYLKSGGMLVLGLGGATLARLALATLVIGLPAFLMGGTLPAIARAVTTDEDGNRRSLGALYSVNTIGALTGVLLTTFLVLEALGAHDTLVLAVVINLLIALAAIRLALSRPAASGGPAAQPDAESAPASSSPGLALPLALGAAFLVGFVFFLMELVWYRMLGPVLGGSIYTFGLILATALAGIGLGGALHPLVFRNRVPQVWHLSATCILEALAIMAPYALGDWLAALAGQLRILSAFGFSGLVGSWVMITGLVVLPAAIIAGLQFPLLISLVGRGAQNLGRQTGLVYAFNTSGAIVGSLAGGFGLMPKLSAPGCWVFSGIILLGLGLLMAFSALKSSASSTGRALRFNPVAIVMVLAFGLTVFCLTAEGPTAAWRHSPIGAGRHGYLDSMNHARQWMSMTRRAIILEADGVESAVGINTDNGYAFLVNGKSDGNVIFDQGTQIMIGLVGAVLHPNPDKALVVGLGTGCTAGWLAEIPGMSRVDVVELEPVVLEMARLSALANKNVLDKAEAGDKVRIIINDAREVLNTVPEKYDLVVSEPSNPYRAGIASLFTREFYQEVANRLAPGGIFLSWCQAYEIKAESVLGILATLRSVFPYVECWSTQYPSDLLFLASMEPISPDPKAVEATLQEYPFKEALRIAWGMEGLDSFLSSHLANNDFVNEAVQTVNRYQINTDDLTPVEYAYAHTVGQNTGFSAVDLFNAARGKGQDSPQWAAGLMTDNTKLFNIIMGSIQNSDTPIPYDSSSLSVVDQQRLQALANWAAGNNSYILQSWEPESKPPTQIEKLALAEGLASNGQEAALLNLPDVEQWWPACAEFVRASLANHQQKPEEAVAAFERALHRLRQSPWEANQTVHRGLELGLLIAMEHPEYAPRIYAAMEETFSLSYFDQTRRLMLLQIAEKINVKTVEKTLTRWIEPNVPWNDNILKIRVSTYSQTGNPLLNKAMDDVMLYLGSTTLSLDDFLNNNQSEEGLGDLSKDIDMKEHTLAP